MSDYLQDYSELNKLCNQVECGFHFIYLFFGKIFIFKIAIMIKIIVCCKWKKIMSHTHTHTKKPIPRELIHVKSNRFTGF